ncbi:MAG: hypothetical protein U0R50_03200 [Gaiellales bacterium]
MEDSEYDSFTRTLAERLQNDPRVVGLVLLGSTAGGHDRFSDHDLFIISVTAAQEELKNDRSWLPPSFDPVLVLRDTAHGLKVLGRNGHLVELAVFDLAELRDVARVNRYRVVFDRDGVEETMREIAAETVAASAAAPSPEHRFAEIVTCALVGALRHRRGESASGRELVGSVALRHLLSLVASSESPRNVVLDDLDAFRRFERAFPELGAELASLARQAPDTYALGLLDLTERLVASRFPGLDLTALEVTRGRLAEA